MPFSPIPNSSSGTSGLDQTAVDARITTLVPAFSRALADEQPIDARIEALTAPSALNANAAPLVIDNPTSAAIITAITPQNGSDYIDRQIVLTGQGAHTLDIADNVLVEGSRLFVRNDTSEAALITLAANSTYTFTGNVDLFNINAGEAFGFIATAGELIAVSDLTAAGNTPGGLVAGNAPIVFDNATAPVLTTGIGEGTPGLFDTLLVFAGAGGHRVEIDLADTTMRAGQAIMLSNATASDIVVASTASSGAIPFDLGGVAYTLAVGETIRWIVGDQFYRISQVSASTALEFVDPDTPPIILNNPPASGVILTTFDNANLVGAVTILTGAEHQLSWTQANSFEDGNRLTILNLSNADATLGLDARTAYTFEGAALTDTIPPQTAREYVASSDTLFALNRDAPGGATDPVDLTSLNDNVSPLVLGGRLVNSPVTSSFFDADLARPAVYVAQAGGTTIEAVQPSGTTSLLALPGRTTFSFVATSGLGNVAAYAMRLSLASSSGNEIQGLRMRLSRTNGTALAYYPSEAAWNAGTGRDRAVPASFTDVFLDFENAALLTPGERYVYELASTNGFSIRGESAGFTIDPRLGFRTAALSEDRIALASQPDLVALSGRVNTNETSLAALTGADETLNRTEVISNAASVTFDLTDDAYHRFEFDGLSFTNAGARFRVAARAAGQSAFNAAAVGGYTGMRISGGSGSNLNFGTAATGNNRLSDSLHDGSVGLYSGHIVLMGAGDANTRPIINGQATYRGQNSATDIVAIGHYFTANNVLEQIRFNVSAGQIRFGTIRYFSR